MQHNREWQSTLPDFICVVVLDFMLLFFSTNRQFSFRCFLMLFRNPSLSFFFRDTTSYHSSLSSPPSLSVLLPPLLALSAARAAALQSAASSSATAAAAAATAAARSCDGSRARIAGAKEARPGISGGGAGETQGRLVMKRLSWARACVRTAPAACGKKS